MRLLSIAYRSGFASYSRIKCFRTPQVWKFMEESQRRHNKKRGDGKGDGVTH